MIFIFYAKSQPKVQTIREHTDELLNRLDVLQRLYTHRISRLTDERFWGLLRAAATYHDVGKIYTMFQNRILETLHLPQLAVTQQLPKFYPHNYISVTLVPWRQLGLSKSEQKALAVAIGYHHEREKSLIKSELLQIHEADIANKVDRLYEHMGIIAKPEPISLNMIHVIENIRIQNNDYVLPFMQSNPLLSNENSEEMIEQKSNWRRYIMLKGLLHRLDHAASAGIDIEDGVDESVGDHTKTFLISTFGDHSLRDPQQFAIEHRDENIIMTASTGIGKTESALLWINDDKGFITLPLRVSLNALYDRIKTKIGIESVGLLHSSSLEHMISDGMNDQEYENAEDSFRLARQLSYKLTFTTIDQVFKFPFLYRGYERELATIAYSKVVIDEIQAYDPSIAAMLVKSIEIICRIGGQFMIMTATMPKLYTHELQKRIGAQFAAATFPSPALRHHLQLRSRSIVDLTDEITEKAKKEKVVVICNTVGRANEVYKILKMSEVNVRLLHTLFTQEDRKRLEEEIQNFVKRENGNFVDLTTGVWVTTQIIEASLDVDFDMLFTEMSTLDSLFQRIGRCFRSRELTDARINIMITTVDCSGIKTVYDEELHKMSIDMLQNFQLNPITEEEKMRLVEQLYDPSSKQFANTKFYNTFQTSLRYFDSTVKPFEITSKEAQEMLRKMESVQVVPLRFWQDPMYRNYIADYNAEKNTKKKQKLLSEIEKKTISLPYYRFRQVKKVGDLAGKLRHIAIVDGVYDGDGGLRIEANTPDII